MVRTLNMNTPSINLVSIQGRESDIISVETVKTIIKVTQHYKEVTIYSIIHTKTIRVYHILHGKIKNIRNVTPTERHHLQPLMQNTIHT